MMAIMKWQTPAGADLLRPSFTLIDPRTIQVIARDTFADLARAADTTATAAGRTLRAMASNGLTVREVNDLIARGVIDGKTGAPIRELRERLKQIHGERITIIDRNGDPMSFEPGYYAKMVVHTRTREATERGRHERFAEEGVDLVTIVGRVSNNFCTAYLGKVFSLSGRHPTYPPISSLPDGPPFHPNCSKSTAAFIEELESPENLERGQTDPNDPMLTTRDRTQLQRRFQDTQGRQQAEPRMADTVEEIRARARAAGYAPPPYSPRERGPRPSPPDDADYIIDPKIKQRLGDLGVGNAGIGKLSDVAQQWVADGIQKASDIGLPIPPTITSNEAEFKSKPHAVAKYVAGRVLINTKYPDLERMPQRALELGGGPAPFWSTTDPHHPLLHEMVHHAHLGSMTDIQRTAMIGRNRLTAQQEEIITREVGGYAASSRTNFVAEVTLGRKVMKKRYSPQIIRWFLDYGGKL